MLPNDGPPSQTTPNGSTLLSKNIPPTGQAKNEPKTPFKGERMWYDHYNCHGHTREIC